MTDEIISSCNTGIPVTSKNPTQTRGTITQMYNLTGNKGRSERGNLRKITRYEFGNLVRYEFGN